MLRLPRLAGALLRSRCRARASFDFDTAELLRRPGTIQLLTLLRAIWYSESNSIQNGTADYREAFALLCNLCSGCNCWNLGDSGYVSRALPLRFAYCTITNSNTPRRYPLDVAKTRMSVTQILFCCDRASLIPCLDSCKQGQEVQTIIMAWSIASEKSSRMKGMVSILSLNVAAHLSPEQVLTALSRYQCPHSDGSTQTCDKVRCER